jgi:hypothetical protein
MVETARTDIFPNVDFAVLASLNEEERGAIVGLRFGQLRERARLKTNHLARWDDQTV